MRRLVLLFISVTAISFNLCGQNSQVGLLPELIATKKLNANWQITGQLETMQRMIREQEATDFGFDYEFRRTDLTFVGSYRLNPNIKLSGGLLNRFAQGEHILRTLQQISLTTRGQSIRFGHRFRTDQTYGENNTTHRLRYRLSNELPLKGDNLNLNEWYLKSSLEHLTIIRSERVNMEQRINLAFGYLITDKQRFELGWDYRTRSLIDFQEDFDLWLMLNYYINF